MRAFFAHSEIAFCMLRHVSHQLCAIESFKGESMEITTREYTLLYNTITDAIEKLNALRVE